MKKLKLNVDAVVVESFSTAGNASTGTGTGTVWGNGLSNERCNSEWSCLPDTCIGVSCGESNCCSDTIEVGFTCPHTCDYGCV